MVPYLYIGSDSSDYVDKGYSQHFWFIFGNGGHDHLTGSDVSLDYNSNYVGDSIYGGDGDDTIDGGNGNDYLLGNDDNDVIYGSGMWDHLEGNQGEDSLFGGDFGDTLLGGIGNDWLKGEDDDDELYGEGGEDTLWGGWGNDTLDGGSEDDLLIGEFDNDTLIGGSGNDRLWADDGRDMLYGGSDNDDLFGGGEFDNLHGGTGQDTMYGSTGNDWFWFEFGDSTLNAPDTIGDFRVDEADLIFMPQQGLESNYSEHSIRGRGVGLEDASTYAMSHIGKDTFMFVTDGQDGYLFADLDHNAIIETAVKLTGLGALTDFGWDSILG
jgi:Ca2+-binding RTX toxin-like protein